MAKKKLYIIGAGGLGRQIAWIVERINAQNDTWNLEGFIDDDETLAGTIINDIKVVGDVNYLKAIPEDVWVVCALGSSKTRKTVIERLAGCPNISFATLIDPSVIISRFVQIGEGSIICAGSIVTVNITIGRHVLVNWDCTIGHDAVIGDFCTVSPSANVCGNVHIGECCEIGVGAQIIQQRHIVSNSVIGGGAVVTKNIDESGTYVGVPAKKVVSKGC